MTLLDYVNVDGVQWFYLSTENNIIGSAITNNKGDLEEDNDEELPDPKPT